MKKNLYKYFWESLWSKFFTTIFLIELIISTFLVNFNKIDVKSVYILVVISKILFLLILFISFFYFTFKWCKNRNGFLSWIEVLIIIIYSLELVLIFDMFELINMSLFKH